RRSSKPAAPAPARPLPGGAPAARAGLCRILSRSLLLAGSPACRPWCLRSGLEDLRKIEERRPEDDQEHRREDEHHGREEHLDRRLHRLLLGGGLALEAAVGRL